MKRNYYGLIAAIVAVGIAVQVGVMLGVRSLSMAAAATGNSDSQGHIVFDPVMRRDILERGRSVMQLVKAGDSDGVFGLFDSQMASAVPLSQLQQVMGQTGSIGDRLGETAAVDNGSVYRAEYQWNAQELTATISFDGDGKISGLLLQPSNALPPDPEAGYETKGVYHLPFAGVWSVFWGGNTLIQNYHAAYVDQRHAYDIVVTKEGSSHSGDGHSLTDYYAFGKSIFAPADATVVEAVDGIADNDPGIMNVNHPAGNHVILDCGNGEYLIMAHFRDHTLRVHKGDHVKAGQPIAECGDSGNSSEPHLHIHLQNGPTLFQATGLPLAFSAFTVDGKPVAKAELVQGEEIRSASVPSDR